MTDATLGSRDLSRLLDVLDRANSGPVLDEKDFDMKHVAGGVARVLKEYDIKFDRDHIIQQDDALVDRLYEASIDFLAECGVYNTSSGRLMSFTRAEIEEAIELAASEVTVGEGADVRVSIPRSVEDPTPPRISGGPIGTPLSEELYVPIMESYFQEEILDIVVPGTLATTFGREIRSKSPLEVIASWQQVELDFRAAAAAGRPGLSIQAVEMSTSDLGHLSAIGGDGYRPTDTHIVAMVSELKTNSELLNKIAHSAVHDGIVLGFYNPILGGLGGPAEGVALLLTAGWIALQVVYQPNSHSSGPTHPFNYNSTDPDIMRAVSVTAQALSRNTHFITELMTSPVSGPGTESLLHECVAMATLVSVCGTSRAFGTRSAAGVVLDHATGLEARFNGEVARAAAGMSREQADEIVRTAVAEYEPLLSTRPIGVPFAELYDPDTVQPRPEWQAMYDKVKEQAHGWGLPFE